MSQGSLTVWDQAQLLLLRCLSAGLRLVDSQFHVRWGERLLGRLVERWQRELAQVNQALTQLEQDRRRLESQVEALSVQAAAYYLGGRGQAGMCLDPADPRQEEILDACIRLLVKDRLAAIDEVEIEPGHYVYRLEPDWAAIRACLFAAAEQAEADTAGWLREGIRYIDETFLCRVG